MEGPLRRFAGQSVRDERDKLLNDQLTEYLLAAIGFCFLAAWEWLRRWKPLPFGAEIFTGAALLMTAYCAFRIFRLRREISPVSAPAPNGSDRGAGANDDGSLESQKATTYDLSFLRSRFRPANGLTFSRKPREPTLSVSHHCRARLGGCNDEMDSSWSLAITE